VDLDIAEGERVLLAGSSGAGKSTLLRALAGLLADDDGDASGTVTVDGLPPHRVPGAVGLLTQDPAASTVAVSIGRDLAFGPENLGLPVDVVADRVRRATAAAAFPYAPSRAHGPGHGYGPDRRTAALSGGERQRLALAGQFALGPRLLLLDEPLAMLDPTAADAVHTAVLSAVADRRTALVVVDHHLDRWWRSVDRLVVLGSGGVVLADGPPDQVLRTNRSVLAAAGLWLPGSGLPGSGLPGSGGPGSDSGPFRPAPSATRMTRPLLRADAVGVLAPDPLVRSTRAARGGDRTWAVRDAATALHEGSVTAVTGPSGAGKSTLLTALAGLVTPAAGAVRALESLARGLPAIPHRWRSRELAARISWTPQTPTDGFVASTVAAEVAATPTAVGRTLSTDAIAALLDSVGLSARASSDPRRLSGGEQRRLAVVAALAAKTPVLLLDEPTVGQDRVTWTAVVQLLRAAAASGVAIGIATHDAQLVDALADTVTTLAETMTTLSGR
jgi:energy-coupling factor transporter ATP-binding protein EcfA2